MRKKLAVIRRLARIRLLAESLDRDDGSEFASLMANIETAVDLAIKQVEAGSCGILGISWRMESLVPPQHGDGADER